MCVGITPTHSGLARSTWHQKWHLNILLLNWGACFPGNLSEKIILFESCLWQSFWRAKQHCLMLKVMQKDRTALQLSFCTNFHVNPCKRTWVRAILVKVKIRNSWRDSGNLTLILGIETENKRWNLRNVWYVTKISGLVWILENELKNEDFGGKIYRKIPEIFTVYTVRTWRRKIDLTEKERYVKNNEKVCSVLGMWCLLVIHFSKYTYLWH